MVMKDSISPYKKCFTQKLKNNNFLVHLWTDEGYRKLNWNYKAYIECNPEEAEGYSFLENKPLKSTIDWEKDDPKIHFNDMVPYQRFLIDLYKTNNTPSTTHKELFFDIEIEMGESLTVEYIKYAPKRITSISYWDKQLDWWVCLIIDEKNILKHTKTKNKEIIPCKDENELLSKFLLNFREIDPDIIISFNGDYFDIPYLYYRTCNVLGEDFARFLSPIGIVRETPWYFIHGQYIQIAGVESLDYMRLHKKFSQTDEPSWSLDALGEKYGGMNKIEYEGNLDKLFREDIYKFIEYNFRDVEILKKLDEHFNYIDLTKNISHRGKHNYSEVYWNTKTQDGAISSYLLDKKIIPPSRILDSVGKRNYAGGFLFCDKPGLYHYMFDEDLVSQYPTIIMSLNMGRETYMGRILNVDDRNNHLGLIDIKKRDPEEELWVENKNNHQTKIKIKDILSFIQDNNWSISANGVFFRTDIKSVLSVVLEEWWEERKKYVKNRDLCYKKRENEKAKKWDFMQYTMKVGFLNSLYGALAIPSFRYGLSRAMLAEATTLTGRRIIQESALLINKHLNKLETQQ